MDSCWGITALRKYNFFGTPFNKITNLKVAITIIDCNIKDGPVGRVMNNVLVNLTFSHLIK